MKRTWALGLMTAVLLLAAFIRFYRLDNQSFWNDEGNSARLSERSVPLIIEGTASDVHPPLYYLLLRGWRAAAGESEFTLRAVSVYFGIVLVAVTYSLGRKLLRQESRWTSIAAAGLVAVNPALVYHSQETRMYEMLAFLAVASCLLLLHLLDRPQGRAAAAAAYVLCMAAGFYTHYFFPAVLIIQLALVIVWLWEKRWNFSLAKGPLLLIAGSLIMAIFIYLPWLPIFFRQTGGRTAETQGLFSFFQGFWRWLHFADLTTISMANIGLVFIILLFAAGLLYLILSGLWKNSYGLVIVVGAAAPIVAMALAGTTGTAFYKFGLMAIPWMALLIALGIVGLGFSSGQPVMLISVLLLAGGLLWITANALQNMYFDHAFFRADYRSIAERIDEENHPSAAIILNAANQWEVFTYYYDDNAAGSAQVLPLPRGNPDSDQIHQELTSISADTQRIYAIFWGEAERDPERLVERWLDDNTFKAQDEWVGDVRFVTYALNQDSFLGSFEDIDLRFGEHILLDSFSLGPRELFPGEIFPITLKWLTDTKLENRYKVFLHLVDGNGQIMAQRDSEPGGGLSITTIWNPNEMVEDNHGLTVPNGIAPGNYTLLLGLYDIADPQNRLLIQTLDGAIDAYPLTDLTVKSPTEE